jgi:DNA-binding MarR family transcriptional regulator
MSEREDLPLGYLLQRAMALLRPQVTAELRPLGLGLPQFVCMRILSTSRERSSAELARDTNVTPQAMDQMLSGLQDLGVVARPEVISSGRARPAKLTAKGRALLKRAEAAVRVADERILIDLTAVEQRQLKGLLLALGSRTGHHVAALCTPSDVEGDGG